MMYDYVKLIYNSVIKNSEMRCYSAKLNIVPSFRSHCILLFLMKSIILVLTRTRLRP